MKNIILLFLFFACTTIVRAQDKYYTKSGKINFYSKTPLEDIEAKNKSVVCVLDTKSGDLQFSVLMKGFEFRNEEMQEHFNSDFLESDQYPKAGFKGQVLNNAAINYTQPGTYPAQVKGLLTIHGITKAIQTNGTITTGADGLKTSATFTIQVADYNIKIPSLVRDKIAKTVTIIVDCNLDPLK